MNKSRAMNQIQQPVGDRQRMVGVVTLAVVVVLLLGSTGWNVLEFTLTSPRFRNSQNSRADLRLYGYENGFYLKSVAVLREEP